MTINRKLLAGVFISMSVIFNSCSVEDGEDGLIGPQGERGEIGPQGPEGERGEPGEDGEDGNMNVIASDWFNVESVNDIFDYSESYPLLTYNWDVPELTSDIAEGGAVLVYAKINAYGTMGFETIPNLDNIISLPQQVIVFYDEGETSKEVFDYSFSEGNILISLYAETLIMDGLSGKGIKTSKDEEYEISLRYILAPSNIMGKNTIENLKKMSYQQVVSYLRINS